MTVRERFPHGIQPIALQMELTYIASQTSRNLAGFAGTTGEGTAEHFRRLLGQMATELWDLSQLDIVDADGNVIQAADPLAALDHCPLDAPF